MLRQIRNYRFNPFTAASSASVITDEVHAIPASGTYWVRLFEAPDEDYVEPTSGTPVYIRDTASNVLTEVSGAPGVDEFRVDYTFKTGWVEFNSANAGTVILVCYRGTGTPIIAEHVNALQLFQPATPFFCGDGSDGPATISSDTNLTEDPSGSGIVIKQYSNLTIDAAVTLGIAASLHGLVIAVSGRLRMDASAAISVYAKGAAGGNAVDTGTGNIGGAGGFGGGGGGGGSAGAGGQGGSAYRAFLVGNGYGGVGGATGANNASSGVPSTILSPVDHAWRSLANLMVYGAGGGSGGGYTAGWFYGYGGAGGGFLIINCNVLDLASGAQFLANGQAGFNTGTNNGGGGGGAGGVIVILANRIIGDTAANVESSRCNVTGGGGGSSLYGAGGNGAAGYKRAIELSEFNVY